MKQRKGIILSDPKERYVSINPVYHDYINPAKIICKYEKLMDENDFGKKYKDGNNKNRSYEFGDILSLYGQKEKYVYLFQSGRFIYVLELSLLDEYNGMKRINPENIKDVYGSIDINRKKILLDNLKQAYEENKKIPTKSKESLIKLLK